jgi:Fe-Mn family superoxide dismutase
MFARQLLRGSRGVRGGGAVQRTWIHTVPQLVRGNLFQREGIKGLYSAQGFKIAWTDYQKHLVDRLTELTIETENETRPPLHIVMNTAQKSDQAHVFNFASQALNNHLFFEALVEPESNRTQPSPALARKIDQQFGGLDALRQEMLFQADTLLGHGWVFLVENADKSLSIQTSYNAGTPYDVSRAQMYDLNGGAVTNETLSSLEDIETINAEGEKNFVVPLLALNIWEHAYIPDYSVAGRADYLEKLWSSINWDVVSSRYFAGDM